MSTYYTLLFSRHSMFIIPFSLESKDIELDIKKELVELMKNPNFLSKVTYIGFGLSYKYPFHHQMTKISQIAERLKGIYSAVFLCLDVELKTYYTERGNEETGEGVHIHPRRRFWRNRRFHSLSSQRTQWGGDHGGMTSPRMLQFAMLDVKMTS